MKVKIIAGVAVIVAVCVCVHSQTPAPPPLSPADKQTMTAFEQRAKQYAKMREGLEDKMPKLSKEAKPEEIQTHKTQFQEDRKSTRLNSSHSQISYAVFCLTKKRREA